MNTIQTDFKSYLKQTSGEIEKELNNFSNEWNAYVKKDFADLKKSNGKFTGSFYGGKMIRGTLVKFGYQLVQTEKTSAIIKPAAAFEILHSSLLIHDDIIDQSPMRRGKPALHINKNNKQYGISQAICLGDLGIILATKLISESDFPTEEKNHALTYFLKIISQTVLGEMLDSESSLNHKRTEKQIMKIYQMKTANYTIVAPLTIGAILGGANDDLLVQLKRFGEPLGIAFQIQDDILGIFGNEKTVGKSTTSDIEENKNTLLFAYGLKHANQKQKTILKKYYGKKNITSEEHEMIKKVFIDTGALEYNQQMIKTLTSGAKKIIPDITRDTDKQTLLMQFTDLLVSRKK